ncbi:MAG: PD-(D/E)XK nuclease family protein [Microgenomates group bacterium]
MTSKHIDKINERRFSFSSLSTFENCKHSFFLTYLDVERERKSNIFSEFGTLCHEILEMYFRNYFEADELPEAYLRAWDRTMKSPPPGFIKKKKYLDDGYRFFQYFDFDKSKYEPIFIEDKIDVDLTEWKIVVKPDLVLRELSTGKLILLDYKTSLVFKSGVLDKDKLNGYKRQMLIYSLFLKTKGINIDEIWLWFLRDSENQFVKFSTSEDLEDKAEKWISKIVGKIKEEDEFAPKEKVDFFCKNLCGVSEWCSKFNDKK